MCMSELKIKYDEILFNEQGSALFDIDLNTMSLNDKVDDYTNLNNIEMLEEEDVSLFDFNDIASSLISLRNVEVQKDIVFKGELV